MHSTPRPMLDSSICCLGERNLGAFPVPMISISTESLIIKGNNNSFPTALISKLEISLDNEAEIKQGFFNLTCDRETE